MESFITDLLTTYDEIIDISGTVQIASTNKKTQQNVKWIIIFFTLFHH